MHRFFITEEQIQGNTATVTGEDVAHISRVLRLQPGENIALCDGQGGEYTGRIERIESAAVTCALSERQACAAEPKHRITLYQCLPKSGKMETIIQKCVELGVYAVVPTVSGRCVVKPDRDFEKKRTRYQRVAYEAAKQSRRGIIPQVLPLMDLSRLDVSAHALTILAYEGETATGLKQALSCTNDVDIGLII
ncbi:MAG: RsmE family RNA methyltransferase, partial [Eubacteriales bacterium]|nr:RsmE family RNA methyltransferase [Eubacteriales bacterium]